MKRNVWLCLLASIAILASCTLETPGLSVAEEGQGEILHLVPGPELVPVNKPITSNQIKIEKSFLYDKYTLDDIYPYKDTVRYFQWEKVKDNLALVENIRRETAQWAILRNYKNLNGEAPLVKSYTRNSYNRITDTLGIERYQSVPLYLLNDTLLPERYGRDGSLVRLLAEGDRFAKIAPATIEGEWYVPKKYLRLIPDTVVLDKVIFIDRHNQNISTLERSDSTNHTWLVRSMNPATTGVKRPPYAQETPLGMFVLQERKPKMIFLKDGSTETGGYAPYASRFCNGGHIHGVPVNAPATGMIEYSYTLGTIPRSHMCVRNATSHAKFIFDWAPVNSTLVFVIE